MAGVVRRDGLREEVDACADALRRWNGADGSLVVDAIARRLDKVAADLARVLDAVPDVPPDPPAADRDELARVIVEAGRQGGWATQPDGIVDAIFASGRLVDAADVRARALEDAADPGALVAAAERGLLTTRDYLLDRAVSEREGTT